MSLPDRSPAPRLAAGTALRLAGAALLSAALAGCFQPLYAENSTIGGPALQHRLQDVEIVQIQGRIGNDLRNALIYDLSGGAGNPVGAPYQMLIAVDSSTSTALVNTASGLPENQIVRVTANWRLIKAGDPKKTPLKEGAASGSATTDTSAQRFANYAAARDAEARAGRMVAEQIKAQLAAYFLRNPPAS